MLPLHFLVSAFLSYKQLIPDRLVKDRDVGIASIYFIIATREGMFYVLIEETHERVIMTWQIFHTFRTTGETSKLFHQSCYSEQFHANMMTFHRRRRWVGWI